MNELSDDLKAQVLLAELQERYSASHKIRERSIQFTLWISGMAIGIGWLLISQKVLVVSQRVALTLLIVALFAGTIYFMMGLLRGFRKNREAMIRSERALGMYDPGMYLADTPLLPREYSHAKRKWSDHFCTLCVWVILVAVSLLVLTWACPNTSENPSTKAKTEQVKGGNDNG